MAEINLLPIDLSQSRYSVKLAAVIKKISILLGLFLVFVTLLGIIITPLLSNEVNNSIKRQSALKQNIRSLEGTEQKLFLIKDRIEKIKSITSKVSLEDSLNSLNNFLTSLPANASIQSVKMDGTITSFSVLSKDSVGMASFLNSIVTKGLYKNLTLTGFVFTADKGYLITLEGS